MPCHAMPCYAPLYYTILYYTILYYTILCYTNTIPPYPRGPEPWQLPRSQWISSLQKSCCVSYRLRLFHMVKCSCIRLIHLLYYTLFVRVYKTLQTFISTIRIGFCLKTCVMLRFCISFQRKPYVYIIIYIYIYTCIYIYIVHIFIIILIIIIISGSSSSSSST